MANNNAVNTTLTGQSGSGAFAGNISPVFTTPTLGVALATSLGFGSTAITRFEVGTWTPTFTFQVPGNLTVAYTVQAGIYMIINNLMYVECDLRFTPTYTTAASAARIGGLPYVRSSSATPIPVLMALGSNVTTGTVYNMNWSPSTSQSYGTLMTGVSAGTPPTLGTAAFPTATAFQVYFQGWFSI